MSDNDETVERVARAIYELNPFEEGGEYVESFLVSPGEKLSWEQARARDAEFAPEYMLPITKLAMDEARAAIAAMPEPWRPIETAPHEIVVLLGWRVAGEWLYEAGVASHGWRRGAVSNMSHHGQATHWRPLPAPPEA